MSASDSVVRSFETNERNQWLLQMWELVCVEWSMLNEFDVDNPQAVEVKAYDYYRQDVRAIQRCSPCPTFTVHWILYYNEII